MSGAYDGYYPSTPYAYSYGNSWRPSEPPSTYERLHTYPARRRSPTPPRRYRPYDGYHPAENNYRPNYRSDEDTTYYNRSPSPDRYSTRVQEPDTWDRSTQWNPPAKPSPWQEVTPTSPKSPVGRQRSDSMLATRMFEPSAAWKQIHTERPVRPEAPRGRTEYQSYGSISPPRRDRSPPSHAGGDRYRPPPTYAIGRSGYDSYRPERSPVAPRRRSPNQISSRHDYSNRRVSASGSIDSSVSSRARHRSPPYYGPPEVRSRSRNRPSVSHGRRSRSRSSSRRSSSRNRRSFSRNLSRSRSGRSRSRDRRSRSRGRRSRSRGRRSRSRNRWSRSRSRSRGSSYISRGRRSPRSFKAGWNHSQASRTKVNGQDSLSPKSAQGSSCRRPASRSSIASTQRSASPHAGVSQTLETREEPQAMELDDVKSATVPSIAESTITGSAVVAEYGLSDQRLLPLQVTTEDTSLNPLPSPKVPPTQDSSNVQSNGITEASSNELGTDHSNERLIDATNLRPPINTPLSPPAQPLRPDSPRQHPSADEPNPTHHSLKTGPMLNGLLPGSDILLAEDLLPTERPFTSLPTPVPTPKLPLVAGTSSPPPHPEDIPNRSEAKSRAELLRIVVMTRMLCDRQTREERVDPVLTSNLAVASLARDARPSSAPDKLIKEVTEGSRSQTRLDSFNQVKGSLVDRFNKRQIALTEKTKRLKKDYLSLHRRWTAHCAQLDEQSKPPTTETEPFQTSARTTRRSMANLGDVVRSDLEMEQIIANLGNDDATDPNHLSLRNLANIPDMVSVTHGKVDYQFDDNNHLVENPAEYYGPRTGTHDWTNTEKEIFLDKFAAYPKQFGVIAEYIPNKTAAQCVDYYYLHKKTLINFRKVVLQYAPNKRRRRGTGKKRGNGLLADIRQHDAEVHRDTSTTGRTSRGKKTHMLPPEPKEPKEARRNPNSSRRRWVPQIEGSISVGSETPTPEPEARPRRRRVAVVPTSRAVSAPFEEVEEDNVEDVERPTKRVKKTRKMKSAVIIAGELTTPEPNSALEQNETITGRRKSQSGNILWSDQDKKVFLALLSQYGDDFKRIAASMPNKTTVQVSNYYKANIVDLNLEQVAATAPKRSPTPERDVRKELHIFAPHSTMSSVTSTPLQASAPMSSLTPQHDPEPNPLYLNHELQTRSLLPTVPPVDASLSAIMHRYIARGYPQPVRPYISNPIQLSSYPSHQAVPYTYPPYAEPMYPSYDARLAPLPPISRMTDPLRGLPSVPSVRPRENPYPVLSPRPTASYPYSLESS